MFSIIAIIALLQTINFPYVPSVVFDFYNTLTMVLYHLTFRVAIVFIR